MENTENIFKKTGAVLEGHFLLTSGLHSPVYWEKFRVLQFPNYTEQLCSMMADHFKEQGIQVVAGPTTGGIILAFEVARQMGIRAIYAEKGDSDKRLFKRGAVINSGERVLVVDDILTTGGSIRQVIEAVRDRGGKVAGVATLVDRSEKGADFDVPYFSCHRAQTETYTPEKCPQCAQGIPLVRLGG